jgi:hypothetical protein
MNMKPDPQEPESRGGAEGSDAAARPDRPAVTDGGTRGKSYIGKPHLTAGKEGATGKRRSRRLMIAVLAVTMAVSGAIWKQDSLPSWAHPWTTVQQEQVLTLTETDVDHAATDAARAALARGEIPPILANADVATRNKVLSGEEKLYTKNLLEEKKEQGIVVHVNVSQGGVALGEDVLTPEHPHGTTFPAQHGVATHFHFTAEQAGPNGAVSCHVDSASGRTLTTTPMATGQSADLETVAQ